MYLVVFGYLDASRVEIIGYHKDKEVAQRRADRLNEIEERLSSPTYLSAPIYWERYYVLQIEEVTDPRGEGYQC